MSGEPKFLDSIDADLLENLDADDSNAAAGCKRANNPGQLVVEKI